MAIAQPVAAPDYSGIKQGITQGYDAQRVKAAQTESTALQAQKDVLARRAAQLGGGPSGAFVGAEQQAGNQSAQRLQQANEGINQQQAQELRGIDQTQLGQQFQTSEREAGQQFQQGNLDKQNALAVAGLTGQYNGNSTLAAQQAAFQQKMAGQTFDYTKAQDQKEFNANTQNNTVATIQNLKNAGYSPDQIGQLLKGVGINYNDVAGVTSAIPQAQQDAAKQTAQNNALAAYARTNRPIYG